MGLYGIKPWFVRRLRRMEDALVVRRVSPDALTFAAVAVSLAAGAAIAAGGVLGRPLLWLAVPPLVLVRLALNALDGSVARRTRTARPLGGVLNETCDRISDAAVTGATAALVDPALALGAICAGFFASFTGVLAQGASGRRDHGGPMGKADRMAVVGAGAVAATLWRPAWEATCWTIVAGALATAAARIRRTARSLGAGGRSRAAVETVVEIPAPALVEEEMLCGYGR